MQKFNKRSTRNKPIPSASAEVRKPIFTNDGQKFKIKLAPKSLEFNVPRNLNFHRFKKECLHPAIRHLTGGVTLPYNEHEAEQNWRQCYEENRSPVSKAGRG